MEIVPQSWSGSPFRIEVRGDTVAVHPLCEFGLDYTSTAAALDLELRPELVFDKVISDIVGFVTGKTVLAVTRRRFLFMKAGRDVRFLPKADAKPVPAGTSIIAWPNPL